MEIIWPQQRRSYEACQTLRTKAHLHHPSLSSVNEVVQDPREPQRQLRHSHG